MVLASSFLHFFLQRAVFIVSSSPLLSLLGPVFGTSLYPPSLPKAKARSPPSPPSQKGTRNGFHNPTWVLAHSRKCWSKLFFHALLCPKGGRKDFGPLFPSHALHILDPWATKQGGKRGGSKPDLDAYFLGNHCQRKSISAPKTHEKGVETKGAWF